MGFIVVPPQRTVIFTINQTNTVMAPNGKAFSSQIKKMSKKPLKYNPEEVMVINVDMAQDMFNFAMDTARECLGKFKKEDEPGMAKHAVDKFNEEYGSIGCQLSVTTMELMYVMLETLRISIWEAKIL